MGYDIIKLEEFKLSGIKIKTTNENQQCIKDMGELWSKFFSDGVMEKVVEPVGYDSYGLYLNYEGDFTKPYEYMASVEVKTTESDLEVVKVPSGKFAKFSGKGDIAQIVGKLWSEVWNTELKRSYKYDFEKYYYSENKSDQLVELYIGIE